jgi:hypothetical protein
VRALIVALAMWFVAGVAAASPGATMSAPPDDQPRVVDSGPIPAELVGHEAHAGRVTVIAQPGLESEAKRLASGAEAALADISRDLIDDVPKVTHVEVRLVLDSADLGRVAPAGRGAPPWAIGVAYPDLAIVCVAMRRGGNYVDPLGTLKHELAHVALGVAIGDRAPHWLQEGFAYQHSAEWSMDRTETLAAMAWGNGIVPLDELDRSFPAEELPANKAYAQSYDFVGYLSRRGRWEDTYDDGDRWPFRRFLVDISHGKSLDEAAKKQFGKPVHELFDEWKSDVSSRYFIMPIGLLGLIAWILISILLMLAWRRRRKLNRARVARWDEDDRQRAELERIRKELADLELRRGLGLVDDGGSGDVGGVDGGASDGGDDPKLN